MKDARPQYDVGALVGRFQVHELHEAHKALIQHVFDNHEKVIIFLGLSPLPVSFNNPLDFESRKQMILAEFPEAIVLYCKDTVSDEVWSRMILPRKVLARLSGRALLGSLSRVRSVKSLPAGFFKVRLVVCMPPPISRGVRPPCIFRASSSGISTGAAHTVR